MCVSHCVGRERCLTAQRMDHCDCQFDSFLTSKTVPVYPFLVHGEGLRRCIYVWVELRMQARAKNGRERELSIFRKGDVSSRAD